MPDKPPAYCVDAECQRCHHAASRHRKPARPDPDRPGEVVCFECLYGPRA